MSKLLRLLPFTVAILHLSATFVVAQEKDKFLCGFSQAHNGHPWRVDQTADVRDFWAENLTDEVDGFFKGTRYLIRDRDPLYTHEFLRMLDEQGIESLKLPPRSPNLNAYSENFVRTIKESCLEQMILFGEDALRNAVFNS